jgi:hypothetical protein
MKPARALSSGTVGILVLFLLVAGMFAPVEAAPPCTVKTLKGTYLFRDLWVNWQAGGAGQETSSAVATFAFDGGGNLTAVVTIRQVDQDGNFTQEGPLSTIGTYTISGGCTVTIVVGDLPGGIEAVVASDGSAFLQTGPVGGFFNNENMIGIGIRIARQP